MNFSRLMYSVDENSMNLVVTLIFSNPSSTDIAVGVDSTPHTTIGEWIFHDKVSKLVCCVFIGYRDFDPGPYTAFFPALNTTSSFNIIVFDNHSFEGYEIFNLTINPPGYVFQGDPSQATVTILDHRGLSFIHKINCLVKA